MSTVTSEISDILVYLGEPQDKLEAFTDVLQTLVSFNMQLQSVAQEVAKDLLPSLPATAVERPSHLETTPQSLAKSRRVRDGALDDTLRTMRTPTGTPQAKSNESRRLNRIMWDGGSNHGRILQP
jgi:hypothetical protein